MKQDLKGLSAAEDSFILYNARRTQEAKALQKEIARVLKEDPERESTTGSDAKEDFQSRSQRKMPRKLQQLRGKLRQLKPLPKLEYVEFRVIILDQHFSYKYHKFESVAGPINAFLESFFSQLFQVNTPFDDSMIYFVSRRESKLEFDMEILVETADHHRGFISPKETAIRFQVDSTRESLNFEKFNMFSQLYMMPQNESIISDDQAPLFKIEPYTEEIIGTKNLDTQPLSTEQQATQDFSDLDLNNSISFLSVGQLQIDDEWNLKETKKQIIMRQTVIGDAHNEFLSNMATTHLRPSRPVMLPTVLECEQNDQEVSDGVDNDEEEGNGLDEAFVHQMPVDDLADSDSDKVNRSCPNRQSPTDEFQVTVNTVSKKPSTQCISRQCSNPVQIKQVKQEASSQQDPAGIIDSGLVSVSTPSTMVTSRMHRPLKSPGSRSLVSPLVSIGRQTRKQALDVKGKPLLIQSLSRVSEKNEMIESSDSKLAQQKNSGTIIKNKLKQLEEMNKIN